MAGKMTVRQTRPPGAGLDPQLQALYENLEILNGARGQGLDKAVLVRDLLDLGLATAKKTGRGVVVPVKPGTGAGGVLPGEVVEPPQLPIGVQVSGGFSIILVEWDKPTYSGHAYTEILRADTDDFSKAVVIATTAANLYSDQIGGNKIAFYWVRFVNKLNVIGPIQSTQGVRGQTQADIGNILLKLRGKIDEGFLTPVFNSKLIGTDTLAKLNASKIVKIDGTILDIEESEKTLHAEADILAEAAMENAHGVDREGIKRRKVTAEIKLVQKTLVTKTEALATQVLSIVAKQDLNTAAINETKTSFLKLDQDTKTAIQSVTQRIDSQKSIIDNHTASIKTNAQTSVSLDGKISNAVKSIGKLTTDTTSAISALSTRTTALKSEVDANKASIVQTAQSLVVVGNKAASNTQDITSLTNVTQTQSTAIGSIRSSIATQSQTITRIEGLANGAQGTADTAKANADSANAAAAAAAGIAKGKGKVIIKTTAPAVADQLPQNLWIDTRNGANTPKRWYGSKWVAVTDKAAKDAAAAAAAAKRVADKAAADILANSGKITVMSETLTKLQSAIGKNTASITTNSQTSVTIKNLANSAISKANAAQGTANGAVTKANTAQGTASAAGTAAAAAKRSITSMSQRITTLDSKANGINAKVTTNAQTIATVNASGTTAYKALWGVKATVGAITAGIGLTVKRVGGKNVSQVTVIADQFSVGSKTGNHPTIYPFIVNSKGVYIDTAYIKAAKIQDLVAGLVVADNIKANAKLTAPYIKGGKIEIGSKFTVDANGNVVGNDSRFNNITAVGGTFSKVLIKKDCTIRGTLDGADGTFSGTFYAENMRGDVYRAIAVNVTERANIKAKVKVASGVFNAEKFPRLLQFPSLNMYGYGAVATVYFYVNNVQVNYINWVISDSSEFIGTHVYYPKTGSSSPAYAHGIAANVHGTFDMYLSVSGASNHRISKLFKQYVIAALYKS